MTLVTDDDFGGLLTSFDREALHLETRDAYGTAVELPHMARWEADEPDHVENIEGFEDCKLHALLAHRSQFRSTMRITASEETAAGELAAFTERLRARHASAGAPAGLVVAETFKALRDL